MESSTQDKVVEVGKKYAKLGPVQFMQMILNKIPQNHPARTRNILHEFLMHAKQTIIMFSEFNSEQRKNAMLHINEIIHMYMMIRKAFEQASRAHSYISILQLSGATVITPTQDIDQSETIVLPLGPDGLPIWPSGLSIRQHMPTQMHTQAFRNVLPRNVLESLPTSAPTSAPIDQTQSPMHVFGNRPNTVSVQIPRTAHISAPTDQTHELAETLASFKSTKIPPVVPRYKKHATKKRSK